jgi:hypothetical protein
MTEARLAEHDEAKLTDHDEGVVRLVKHDKFYRALPTVPRLVTSQNRNSKLCNLSA